MNLLKDPWVPVRFFDGSFKEVSVTELFTSNLIADLHTVRSDFYCALKIFLIALLQTCNQVTDSEEWNEIFDFGINLNKIQQALDKYAKVFELEPHQGVAFMQYLKEDNSFIEQANRFQISRLLFGYPGQSTIDKNQDLFVKRDAISALCPTCATQALIAQQRFASQGGQGYRQALTEKDGALCLVSFADPKTPLWKNLWLNVIYGVLDQDLEINELFGWMQASQDPDTDFIPLVRFADPRCFWEIPRSINLIFENAPHQKCSLCGKNTDLICRQYKTKPASLLQHQKLKFPFASYDKKTLSTRKAKSSQNSKPQTLDYKIRTISDLYFSIGWIDFLHSFLNKDLFAIPQNVAQLRQVSQECTFKLNFYGYLYLSEFKFFPSAWFDTKVSVYNFKDPAKNQMYLEANHHVVNFLCQTSQILFAYLDNLLDKNLDAKKIKSSFYKVSFEQMMSFYDLFFQDYLNLNDDLIKSIINSASIEDLNEKISKFYKVCISKTIKAYEDKLLNFGCADFSFLCANRNFFIKKLFSFDKDLLQKTLED